MDAAGPQRLLLLTVYAETAITPDEPSIAPAARADGNALEYRPIVSELRFKYLHDFPPANQHPAARV
jgi:hypothetical protein